MSNNKRAMLGLILILTALFYGNIKDSLVTDSKLEKPKAQVLEIVEGIPEISDSKDANKLAGIFNALSESEVPNTNLEVQYYLDNVGRNTVKAELMNDSGESKYPAFAPATAKAIERVIGPQDASGTISQEKRDFLKEVFYGISWKLYNSAEDETYEQYKNRALKNIKEYYKTPDDEDEDDPVDDCECVDGYIIHGDGHKTKCPCEDCDCDNSGSMDSEQEKVSSCPCETAGTYCVCDPCECTADTPVYIQKKTEHV